MICPKCGSSQPQNVDCGRCGVIIARYRGPMHPAYAAAETPQKEPAVEPIAEVPEIEAEPVIEGDAEIPEVEAESVSFDILPGTKRPMRTADVPVFHPFEDRPRISRSVYLLVVLVGIVAGLFLFDADRLYEAMGLVDRLSRLPDQPAYLPMSETTPRMDFGDRRPARKGPVPTGTAKKAPPEPSPICAEVKDTYLELQSGPSGSGSFWHEGASGFETAVGEQKSGGAPMVLYFWVEWCPHCHAVDPILADAASSGMLDDYIKVNLNPERSDEEKLIARTYGVTGYPRFEMIAFPGARTQRFSVDERGSAENCAQSFKSAYERALNEQLGGATDIQSLTKRLEYFPRNADIYFLRGRRYLEAHDVRNGMLDMLRALRVDSDYKPASELLGENYLRLDCCEDAVEALANIADYHPEYNGGWALQARARAYWALGNYDAALSDARKACELNNKSGCGLVEFMEKRTAGNAAGP